ncbi:DUF4143 domain-containing protein [Brachybacterium sp. Marseille-Q7125]|uniref:ATP-binding protein n=1 Tax=Brachybacterium sp. Marseille-Q7125 TaxID=2932815 RepID=UPI001FF20F12
MDTYAVLGRRYEPRIIDRQVTELLRTAGAVVIEGPRACGKTMTGLHHAKSLVQLDSPGAQFFIDSDPQALLAGEAPRLLDEWQLAPQLWNMVRRAVDAASAPGRFILTGSAVPADDISRHTGAGRFLRLRERTMTWYERGASTSAVPLEGLFAGEAMVPDPSTPSLQSVVDNLSTSGFPAMTELTLERQQTLLRGYLEEVARADLPRLGRIRQKPAVLSQLLRSIARMTGAELSYSALLADTRAVAPDIRLETVSSYVELLGRLFIVELIPPFATKLRSRARLRTTPKIHMADPALAIAALDADPADLTADPATLGFLFESAVIHDLTVMVEAMGGRLSHYRDSNGHEIDAVLELPGRGWAAVEIKLGGRRAIEAAESLRRAVAQIDAPQPPAFMAVITGTGFTAPIGDDVVTFPLGALCP